MIGPFDSSIYIQIFNYEFRNPNKLNDRLHSETQNNL